MSDDYLIRVPADWLTIDGADALLDVDRLWSSNRPFQVMGTVPHDALSARMDYERPLQPGETRDVGGGNSIHMHSGDDCPCHPEGGAYGFGAANTIARAD
jgi:hypothetical protein